VSGVCGRRESGALVKGSGAATEAARVYHLGAGGNYSVRVRDWRYNRYFNGDEELYHNDHDPQEWTNLASIPKHAANSPSTRIALLQSIPGIDYVVLSCRYMLQRAPAHRNAARLAKKKSTHQTSEIRYANI
jgi:hypothetical protein